MERLNDILARTPHPRTRGAEQQANSAAPSQGPRPGMPPRRPLREQTAHLGPVSRPPRMREPYRERHTSGELAGTESGESLSLQQERQQTVHPAYPRQRFSQNESAGMPSYSQQPSRTVQDFQRSQSRMDGARSPQSDDFASARDRGYPRGMQADVQQEWEDDTADMRYGDWENDGDDEELPQPRDAGITAMVIPATNRAAARISQTLPDGDHHLVTRQLRSLPDAEPPLPVQGSQYITRDLRDVQMPSGQLPAPRSFSEEPRRSHHFTQPLKPQQIARMNQNMPSDVSRIQQSVRHDNTPEQSAQLIPAPYTSPKRTCPVCKGAGYLRADVPFGHPNFGKPIACECKEVERKEKRRLQLQGMSNLGDVGNKSFQNFNPEISGIVRRAFQEVVNYAEDPKGWLVLIGPNGCGKTHLAAAIANQYLEEGAAVLFITVIDLLEHLRATFAPTSTVVYDQLFSRMREAALLVLDDLGAHQSSPWANEKLFQLLNYRYNLCIPTIITMNNSAWSNIEERIRSRMSDYSLVATVRFDGAQDYRPRNPRR
jgi:DNA replication protein DnaC